MQNNLILKRFFSKKMINDLLSQNHSDVFDCVVKRYIKDPDGKKYDELISEIYTFLGKEYRTEYFYKNTILNKLLLNRHDYKKTVALTELPIGESKADFLILNGKGIVYEIKTELDNLERIENQIEEYYKAFTEVFIVTYKENIEKVLKIVPEKVGILELTKRHSLKIFRDPQIDSSNLDYYTIFKILRKKEFENILISNSIDLPDVIQFKYYKECFKLIKNIDIEKLQKQMILQLKSRMKIETIEFAKTVPTELRFLTYFDTSIIKKCDTFETIMSKNYGG